MQNQINNQNINGISLSAVPPQINSASGYAGVIQQLEDAIRADAERIKLLIQQGTISENQGQYLMTQLAAKYNEINMYKNSNPAPAPAISGTTPAFVSAAQNPVDLFNQENPGFFEKGSRAQVRDYIRNFDMDKDEISKIARMVECLENSAVDSYLKKSAHEKSLNDENSAAKSKLTSYAQSAAKDAYLGRIFTREDIGRMTGDEFAKNEKIIMEQAKLGLIK